jgi:hypothetical protein
VGVDIVILSAQRVSQAAAVAACLPHSASYRGCSHAKQNETAENNTTPDRSGASAATITTETATVFKKKYASGHQPNLRSVRLRM